MYPEVLFSYIDPMAGSLLLQAIIAGVVGAVVFFRRHVGLALKRLMNPRGKSPTQTTASDEQENQKKAA